MLFFGKSHPLQMEWESAAVRWISLGEFTSYNQNQIWNRKTKIMLGCRGLRRRITPSLSLICSHGIASLQSTCLDPKEMQLGEKNIIILRFEFWTLVPSILASSVILRIVCRLHANGWNNNEGGFFSTHSVCVCVCVVLSVTDCVTSSDAALCQHSVLSMQAVCLAGSLR